MDGEDVLEDQLGKKRFQDLIDKFNGIYRLPQNQRPSLPSVQRLKNFKNILNEELDEVDAILEKYSQLNGEINDENDKVYSNDELPEVSHEKKVELLTDISDWLGDMIVYITSEARKYGIDMDRTLGIIMESNFSKLGEGGKPIYDDRGKVLKGPDYRKPEPKISEFLNERLKE